MAPRLNPADRAEIIRLYTTPCADGTWNGAPTIARRFGVTHGCVQFVLKRAGVATRNSKTACTGKRCKPITNVPVGEAPRCACGCGSDARWNRRKNRWNTYADGHYRKTTPYKDEAWLREQYVNKQRTVEGIAAEFGVSQSTIAHFMVRFDIKARRGGEALAGRMSGALNPAWRGGVAQWDYAPDWKAIAQRIRGRDEWTCQLCGKCRDRWGGLLHVHHIDSDKLNNSPTNLISLCATCHPRGRAAIAFEFHLTVLASTRPAVAL